MTSSMRPFVLSLSLCLTACATTYREPTVTGPTALSFTLTPEQCAQLAREHRGYKAAQDTSIYLGGAGALVSLVLQSVPAFRSAAAAQGAAAGVGLAAGAVGAFTGSQVSGLEHELADGGCGR